MTQNLETVIKANPHGIRVLQISRASFHHLNVGLLVLVCWYTPENRSHIVFEINCINAVDCSIRPKDPGIIVGGPLIEFYEDHQLLNDPQLQCRPGGDGEIFDPPLKLKLLKLDQSYVIAERFDLIAHEPKPTLVP